jgi:Fe-S oxidoreductase
MAGSFGFERGHYEVSMACGEQMLFPEVRRATGGDLLVADGFSCRTQIEAGTGRRALHLAEVLRLAHRDQDADERERAGSAASATAPRWR